MKIDFGQSGLPPQKLRLSVLVVGVGLLLAVSVMNPFQVPPFGGHYYLYWLAGMTVLLGVIALIRGERGHLALVAAVVTVAAACFILVTVSMGVFSIIAMKLFMAN